MSRFVSIGESRLWTTESGSGSPLLLFNGGPGCDDYLEPVARLVADVCRVVRFEARGCGRSSWDGHYDLATLIEDAEAIRRAYGIENWMVAGHSPLHLADPRGGTRARDARVDRTDPAGERSRVIVGFEGLAADVGFSTAC